MSESDLETRLGRALSAILDDSPAYAAELTALADDPSMLAGMAAQPALVRPLLGELRKLRPVALWVRDGAAVALAQKRDLCLDGALCRLAPGEQLPVPEGRENWLEVDARSAESTLRALPSGWGVVVSGDLTQVSFTELRRAAPLRALGAVLGSADARTLEPGARLDVVVADVGADPFAVRAARVLWACEALDERQLLARPIPSSGVICHGTAALSWALRLASRRSPWLPT
jgi:hypothetical protein